MSWVPCVALGAVVVMAACAQGGRDTCDMQNRVSWTVFIGGLALAWAMAQVNVWAGLLCAVYVLGLLHTIPWSDAILRSWLPGIVAASTWYALAPTMARWMIVPLLWVLVGVGVWAGAWTIYSSWQGKVAYQHVWGRLWGWMPRPIFCWHEDSPTHLKAGQGNANHLLGLAILSLAAMAGLLTLGHWIAGLALPVLTQPLLHRVNKEGILSQGHVHLGVLLLASWMVFWSSFTAVVVTLAAVFVGLCLVVRPWRPRQGWVDGSRFALWNLVLREVWWPLGWRRRVLGVGTATWEPLTAPATIRSIKGTIFTTAHNEYVQILVEHGVVGLLILGGYLGSSLWRLWLGGPEGHALLPLGITMLAVAMTNFPWTAFHAIPQGPSCSRCGRRVGQPGQPIPEEFCHCPGPMTMQPSPPLYVGSPTLTAVSLMLALLVEAI